MSSTQVSNGGHKCNQCLQIGGRTARPGSILSEVNMPPLLVEPPSVLWKEESFIYHVTHM